MSSLRMSRPDAETLRESLQPESRLLQMLQDVALSITAPSITGRIGRYILRQIRSGVLSAYDPAVIYELAGSKLLLPFSHQLPYILQLCPEYTMNIARLAKHVQDKYSDMAIIDIGANVGDTLAIIRSTVDAPVLCIEGEDRFFALLEGNAKRFSNVELAHAFVGTDVLPASFKVSSNGGTARLTATDSQDTVPMRTLDAILDEHPSFRATLQLIKIDTDGFDVPILLSSLDLLGRRRPVVFFEYSPFHLTQLHVDGLRVFERLREIGFALAIIWENGGEFLLSADLGDERLFQDLHHYYSGRRGGKYCDIALFAAHDRDVFDAVRAGEITLFQALRGAP
ncbi:MAG: hypothetical protein DMF73_17740 [Acidobacteria bacterium]|nr:MAG: hypothetical protein DMF73_17740 [Acidobacteriota bacterium]